MSGNEIDTNHRAEIIKYEFTIGSRQSLDILGIIICSIQTDSKIQRRDRAPRLSADRYFKNTVRYNLLVFSGLVGAHTVP